MKHCKVECSRKERVFILATLLEVLVKPSLCFFTSCWPEYQVRDTVKVTVLLLGKCL